MVSYTTLRRILYAILNCAVKMQVSHQVSMQFKYRDPAGLKILNPDCILGSIHLRIDPAGPQALHLPCGNIPFRGGASPAPASAKLTVYYRSVVFPLMPVRQ